ncbi:MAG: hypothetical protein H6672_07400 [Anaerolineaceae bacterium]|nr:hypothetical protein [Anaerolineaceae bacterium]
MISTRSLHINRPLVGLVIGSLLLTLLHDGPLYGSFAALVLTVASQVYLPGFLVARALGKTGGHWVVRFAWALACGLSLTIILGAAFRLLNSPVLVYLLLLHGVMLILTVIPVSAQSDSNETGLSRAALPYYAVVTLACLVAVGVTYESRYRFFGFEDQAVFISQVDWLANNPGEQINDLPLRSRQIGVLNGDTRNDSDGWTYTHAAWVWTSGVPAAQLLWYDIDPLFVWVVPLLFFALAYTLTGQESAGAWSALAVVVVGLLTFDNLTYNPSYSSFGRFALFEVSTLRQASITFMLPLGLLAGLSYLKSVSRRGLFLTLLMGLALAIMHPFQATIFAVSMGATGALIMLAHPSRKTIRMILPLFAVLLVVLSLPVVQRLNRSGLSAVDSFADDSETGDTGQSAIAAHGFLLVEGLPLVGDTYIMQPDMVFYHPVILVAVVLGLLFGWGWRRNLAAQYLFAVTAAGLIIFFVPGVTELYVKVASWVGIQTTVFLLPVVLAYGLSIDRVFRVITTRKPGWEHPLAAGAALVSALLLVVLLYEPFPLAASPRDQINAYNEIQGLRRERPEQAVLIEYLRTVLSPDTRAVILSPYETANIIVEDIFNTLTTGGRASRNTAAAGDKRFFTLSDIPAPWLDTADLDYLQKWGVTHIVLRASDTRLPQLRLQPERFPFLGEVAGYEVFAVEQAQLEPTPLDDLFARMNATYAEGAAPTRWGRDGFNLIIPGSPERWDALVAAWENQPESDLSRLGMALSATLAGNDTLALPTWDALYAQYPAISLYANGAASTAQYLTPGAENIAPLLANLDSADTTAQVLAARSLLTGTFFYLLSPEQLDAVLAVTEAEPVTWGHLADFDQPDALRKRVSLLMNAGRWDTARMWLDQLPAIEISPADMLASAAMLLVQGDVDGALAYLQPATDDDWLAGKRYWHPDRWEQGKNLPEQAYYLLLGEQARRAGEWAQAESHYQQAIAAGAEVAGKVFLAQLWQESGKTSEGETLLQDMEISWLAAHDSPLPELESLLTLADTGALYAMQPAVTRDDETTLTVWATYGGVKPHGNAYPIQDWRIQVVNPADGALLAQVDTPAWFVDGTLIRLSVDIPVSLDDLPELTAAVVVIQPRYDNAVTAGEAFANVVLNRPDSAIIPPDAIPAGLLFGEHISLAAYRFEPGDDQLTVTLYWETDTPLADDYQVFVHVVGADGQPVAQQDGTPVDNRYPTGQWRVDTVIADSHTLTFDAPLPPGTYRVLAGLYRLPEAVRLPVTPAGEQVENDAVILGVLER